VLGQPVRPGGAAKAEIVKELKNFFRNLGVEIDEAAIEDSFSVFGGELVVDNNPGNTIMPEGVKGDDEVPAGRKISLGSSEISIDELGKLVWEMPLPKIVEKFDCPLAQVRAAIRSNDIQMPPNGYWNKARLSISKEKLQALVDVKPITEVAASLDVDSRVIVRLCKEMGVNRPPVNYWNKYDLPFSKDDLQKLLFEKPVAQIAREIQKDPTNLWKFIKREQMSVPPRGYWNERTEKPSKEALQQLLDTMPKREVAERCNVSISTLDRWIHDDELVLPQPGHWNKGRNSFSRLDELFQQDPIIQQKKPFNDLTSPELTNLMERWPITRLADWFNVNRTTVYNRCTKLNIEIPKQEWSFDDLGISSDELQEMLRKVSISKIAAKLGVNRYIISRFAKSLGLEIPKHGQMNKVDIQLTNNELRELVWEMPVSEIAKQRNLNQATLYNRCKMEGIQLPPKGYWHLADFGLDKDALQSLVNQTPLWTLARDLDRDVSTIKRECARKGVNLPDPSKWHPKIFNPTKDVLEKLVAEKSLNAIAKEYGVKQTTVTMRCIEYGIEAKEPGFWSRYDLEEIKEYASKYYPGYEALEITTESPTKVKIRCDKEHESWVMTRSFMHSIKQYCGTCRVDCQYKSQKICQEIAESVFGKKFDTERRFPWFLSELGNPRKVDMYFEFSEPRADGTKGIAIEYNGEQHYRFVEFFHRTMEAFLDYKQGDMDERRLFKDHGIFLLEIPYTVSFKVMRDFIIRACTRRGIPTRN
jgi:transposase